ncbi:ATP-dependent Clp protease adapter ClpS [Anthocerotibacter panamensis]|uniref:ATP-dependent Clp protease adapter ClpS n=1 Tax=Anthocerotibacter panamensis TaxID=2857077 RepID=UPI001C4046C5|nr:ATP-dependent Clp protease adapter ClpS [Anthocerotibacter panamensis]
MGTEIIEKPKSEVSKKPAPQYKVLLHNDPHNSMEHVVEVLLMTIPRLKPPQAIGIMMEAHTSGVAVVVVCALEHAEFYCEQLKSHGLTSTIEPDV